MRLLITIISIVIPILTFAQSTIRLAFTGDIMMGTAFPDSSYLPPNNGANLFKEVSHIIKNVDCAFGNLEGVLLDKDILSPKYSTPKDSSELKNLYAFRTPECYVQNLVNAGFDAISIANNHANDFGIEGKLSTMNALKEARIHYAGQKGYCDKITFTIGNTKYGFCAFGHSNNTPNINNLEETISVISSLKEQCDVIIVSFHGGGEGAKYSHVPDTTEIYLEEKRGNVKEFAHTCIDAGADIVYGHGPHVPRAIELYKGHLIAYSLGNFCTPYRVYLLGKAGHAPILEVNINKESGKFISGKIHSFIQERGIGPRIDKNNIVAKNIKKLTLSDFPDTELTISDNGVINKKQ